MTATSLIKAVGYKQNLPIAHGESLLDVLIEKPVAKAYDLLVQVKAIAVNPVDCKIRTNIGPDKTEYKVIGWDAVGVVVAVGELVNHFAIGDEVYYAGDLTRSGSNAEFQLVDERIVGKKPLSVSNAQAAALPLTTITAWELLFNRLAIPQQKEASNDVLLVVGAAGGVGSILLQLAKALTGITVIATASRPSSVEWVKQLGADFVVDHSKALAPQIKALNINEVTHVASLNGTDTYIDDYVEVLKPFGKIGLIDDPKAIDITKLKRKSLSLHWEFMYTRSMFNTRDMAQQGVLLNEVAALVDAGIIKTTFGKHLGAINAANLKQAHAELESGKVIGKLVLEGF